MLNFRHCSLSSLEILEALKSQETVHRSFLAVSYYLEERVFYGDTISILG